MQQLQWSILVFYKSCGSPSVIWIIMGYSNCWIIWVHSDRKVKEAQLWSEKLHFWFKQFRKLTWSRFKAATGPKIKQSFARTNRVKSVYKGRKNKLSLVAERKLIRILPTRNHQNANLQGIRGYWNSWISVHSPVCFTPTWAEALQEEKWSLLLITWRKKKNLLEESSVAKWN